MANTTYKGPGFFLDKKVVGTKQVPKAPRKTDDVNILAFERGVKQNNGPFKPGEDNKGVTDSRKNRIL